MMPVRDAAVVVTVAALAALATLTPPAGWLGGLSVDALFWLRHLLVSPAHAPEASPVAVVAIDEATYRHPDYRDTPRVLWTGRLAGVVERLLDAGATVITFDAIFPTSLEARLPGVDRPFLRALRRGGREGRIVLASVQHARVPIAPHAGQAFAVGAGNIRAANVDTDVDGVIRRVSLAFARADGGLDPSMSVETALRAAKGQLALAPGPVLLRDGAPLRGTKDGTVLVDFFADQRAMPTYSLADLDDCASAGNDAFFRDAFAGKVVFIGLVLDVEDRRSTSMRLFAAPDEAAYAPPCLPAQQAPEGRGTVAREAIPGVYIHAFAVASLLRGETLAEAGPYGRAALVFVIAALIGTLTLRRTAAAAGGVLAAGVASWLVLCLAALVEYRTVLPLIEPALAAAAAFAVLSSYRFAVTDRDKRRLRQMFGYYLAPSVVDRMVGSGAMPALGGETRTVTIFFSDIAGFTALSEGRAPAELVTLLNRYLSAMSDIVEAHGGFVDKYIGDAIVAVFGAPHDDPAHARHAVRAAIACQERLAVLNDELALSGGLRLGQRIGLNTGAALVGNIGSARRFNYTVLGDAVNLAARLEGANKVYGSAILVSDTTAAACAGDPLLLRIDRVAVVGRAKPVDVFVPLPDGCDAAALTAAVEAYLAGRFAAAAGAFDDLATTFPPAGVLAQRCRILAHEPPSRWPGYYTLAEK